MHTTPGGGKGPQSEQRSSRPTAKLAALLVCLLSAWIVLSVPRLNAKTAGVQGLAVATEAPRATQEAMKVLRAGGNAADAAIVAALVSGVVSPSSSGIGGGAFVHHWDATQGLSTILDARERAPSGLVGAEFETTFSTEQRGKWVGVPGEVAGLFELHRRFGSKPWSELVNPAIVAAERGFEVSPHLARALRYSEQGMLLDPGLTALWLRGGAAPNTGSRAKHAALGQTLRRIARSGPKGFYEGPVAADIVRTVAQAAGWLNEKDLLSYEVKERQALRTTFGDAEILTMPPPSAGGMMLVQAAKVFTKDDLSKLGFNTPAYQHALAESFRASLADRFTRLGDPDVQAVAMDELLDDERMKARRASISLERTHLIPRFAQDEQGTHHLVVADAQGNHVSLTTTVNRAFGAKLLAKASGVVLNDELADFSKNAWMKPFGKTESPNRARPQARPVSSMTPTIVVQDGKVVLAAGGSGGMNIATDVAQMVLGRLVFGLPPDELLRAPRFQIPLGGGDTIAVMADTSPAHMDDLRRRGELVKTIDFTTTAVQLITSDDGVRRQAAADPRKFGLALVH